MRYREDAEEEGSQVHTDTNMGGSVGGFPSYLDGGGQARMDLTRLGRHIN
jgi:hypothetical protein